MFNCVESESSLANIKGIVMDNCSQTFTQHFLTTSVNANKIQFVNLKYLQYCVVRVSMETIEALVDFVDYVHIVQQEKNHLLLRLTLDYAADLIKKQDNWCKFSNIIKKLYLSGLIILNVEWKRADPTKSSRNEIEQENFHVDKVKSFCHDINSAMLKPSSKEDLQKRLNNNSMCE